MVAIYYPTIHYGNSSTPYVGLTQNKHDHNGMESQRLSEATFGACGHNSYKIKLVQKLCNPIPLKKFEVLMAKYGFTTPVAV
jgi:hypothetical protein